MLTNADQQLFLFLNSLNSPFWDQVMWVISGTLTWVPLYIVILYALVKKYQRKTIIIVLIVALGITLSDQLSVFLKNIVQRPRPCHEPSLEGLVHIVRNSCGGLYGFVSSHATNTFTFALFSLSLIRRRWYSITIILWALVVGYSRIYLGVHYPGDVIAGSFIGALTGWGVYKIYGIIDRKYLLASQFFSPSLKNQDVGI